MGGYGVDIFLILSGFGLTYSIMTKEELGLRVDWGEYYKKRVKRIIPTYVLVGTIYYLILCDSSSQVIYNLSFANFIIDGKRDFWYIFALLICYLVFPIYGKLKQKVNFRILLVVLSIISVLITVSINILNPECYMNWEIALWRFPCFWMGCYYGVLIIYNRTREFYISTVVFTLVGFILFMCTGFSRNTFTFLSPVVMIVFCKVLELIRIYAKVGLNILRFFGGISLEIYLVHVSFGVLLLNYIYRLTSLHWLSIIAYFCVSVILAVCVQCLIKNGERLLGLIKNNKK